MSSLRKGKEVDSTMKLQHFEESNGKVKTAPNPKASPGYHKMTEPGWVLAGHKIPNTYEQSIEHQQTRIRMEPDKFVEEIREDLRVGN